MLKIQAQSHGSQSAVLRCADVMQIKWQVYGGCDWLFSNTHGQTGLGEWFWRLRHQDMFLMAGHYKGYNVPGCRH